MKDKIYLTNVALEICADGKAKASDLLQNYQMEHGYLTLEEVMHLMCEVERIKRIWAQEEAEFRAQLNFL